MTFTAVGIKARGTVFPSVRCCSNICYWPAGRSGLENAALGLRPRAAFSRPRTQFFPIRTDPKPDNNIFIFFSCCKLASKWVLSLNWLSAPLQTIRKKRKQQRANERVFTRQRNSSSVFHRNSPNIATIREGDSPATDSFFLKYYVE